MQRLRSFLADQAGNTAVVFGLAAIPIVALGGGAVDLAHRADIRVEIQSATDAAALAAARIVQAAQAERDPDWDAVKAAAQDSANAMFRASITGIGESANAEPVVAIEGMAVTVFADVDVETSFLTLVGISSLNADAFAEVNLPALAMVEMALVLDYSGSMEDNDKYVRMTNAATTFIEKVGEARGERSRIGIVPFSEYVYATLRGGDIRGTGPAEANEDVAACLRNRDYPYSVTDETPYSGVEASLWPQADPSGPECQEYPQGGLQLHDLTDDFGALTGALATMRPVGLTNITLAAEMGWHILSANRPFETARDYSDSEVQKILILLTDGMQTVEAMGPGGDVSTLAADEATAELCQNAKDTGIRIFTIAYDLEEQRVHDLLSGCASGASSFFEAEDADDISDVFDGIYTQIAESMWLSR